MSESPDFSVAGKKVLVTGGIGGLGWAITEAFAGLGAEVIATDLAPLERDLPPRVQFEQVDVRSDAQVADLAARYPVVDVLIHCAAGASPADREREFEADVFLDVVDVHLVGAARLVQHFRPALRQTKGSIILIASMYSYFGSAHGGVAYSAAKTGILGLTRSYAVYLAKEGIRANAIAPGWFVTERSRVVAEDPVWSAKLFERLPIGRWGNPSELAGVAVFLASDAARMITGVTLPVDGGYTSA
ncbi:SDR family NAD(P)-dependent oxidoreductase [Jatrophihabitans sp. DSM 45814]